MNPRFEHINGTLCLMLEKPIPLTKDTKFPCVVRLIQDDSPMGIANRTEWLNYLTDVLFATHIDDSLYPKLHHKKANSNVDIQATTYYNFEIIGYPVADGSAEWALWQMIRGNHVIHEGLMPCNIFCNMVTWLESKESKHYIMQSIDKWLMFPVFKDGWQLYEPKTEPETLKDKLSNLQGINNNIIKTYVCPICNETIEAEQERLGHDRYDNDLCSDLLSARVGDHMRSCHDTCDAPNPESATQESLSVADATQPQYQVGDWVEIYHNSHTMQELVTEATKSKIKTKSYEFDNTGMYCRKIGARGCICGDVVRITSKLQPSEVVIPIKLQGTVRTGMNESCFELSNVNGGWITIGYSEIDQQTRQLVESLLKAQEGE